MASRRVVIVGGGFGGVAAVRALKNADTEVLLIDRRNHHIFQPLLYQVATALLSPSEIAGPLRQLARTQPNLSVMLGEVLDIDTIHHTLTVDSPRLGKRTVNFAALVVATGVSATYFGHEEFRPFAPSLKTIADAEGIRSRILSAYEIAEHSEDPGARARAMTFAVVGAGPTGVELAASIATMARVTLRTNFRRIDPASTSVLLLEGGQRILPTFHESLAAKAQQKLKSLGVQVRTGVTVEGVDGEGVLVAGERIPCGTIVWAAGVQSSPIIKQLGAEMDRAGRAKVSPYLHLTNDVNVFVVGDAAAVTQDNRPLPGVAQVAIQQGRYVGKLIAARLANRSLVKPFRYQDRGNMAVVGKDFAVLERGDFRMSGRLTWLLWVLLHVLFLPQMQNRLRVQTQWVWSYFTGQRSSRLIPERTPPSG